MIARRLEMKRELDATNQAHHCALPVTIIKTTG